MHNLLFYNFQLDSFLIGSLNISERGGMCMSSSFLPRVLQASCLLMHVVLGFIGNFHDFLCLSPWQAFYPVEHPVDVSFGDILAARCVFTGEGRTEATRIGYDLKIPLFKSILLGQDMLIGNSYHCE